MLAAAARSADVTLDVLVDLNVGMYRCGIYWESVEGEQRPLPCVFACAHNRHGLGALEAIPKPAQPRSPPPNSLRADIVALCKLAHSLEGVRFKGLMGCARTHAASCHKAHTAALLLRWPVVLAFRSCLEGRDCRVFKNTRTRFSRVLDCIHYYCKRVLYIYKKIIKVQPSRILLKRGRRFFLKMTRWRSYEGHAQEKANNVTESAAVAGAPLPHACPCPCPPWAAAPPARLTSTLLLRPVVPVPRPSSHAARVQRRDGRGHARSAHQRRRQWQLLHLRGRRARAGHDRPPLPSHARTHPSA